MLVKKAFIKDSFIPHELDQFKDLPSSELIDILIRKGYRLKHKLNRIIILENKLHKIYLVV